MRKIIDRIKELNEVLPEVFLVDLLYLLAGELVIWFLVPNKQMCAVGFFMGVVYSIFSSVHMSFRIRKIVYGHANPAYRIFYPSCSDACTVYSIISVSYRRFIVCADRNVFYESIGLFTAVY